MSSTLGTVGSYALAVQNMQISLIKTNMDMQKQAIDILLNPDNSRMVSTSDSLGTQIDIQV